MAKLVPFLNCVNDVSLVPDARELTEILVNDWFKHASIIFGFKVKFFGRRRSYATFMRSYLTIPSYVDRLPAPMGEPGGGSLTAYQWMIAAMIICLITLSQIWDQKIDGDPEKMLSLRVGDPRAAQESVDAIEKKRAEEQAQKTRGSQPPRNCKRTARSLWEDEDREEDAVFVDAGARETDIYADKKDNEEALSAALNILLVPTVDDASIDEASALLCIELICTGLTSDYQIPTMLVRVTGLNARTLSAVHIIGDAGVVGRRLARLPANVDFPRPHVPRRARPQTRTSLSTHVLSAHALIVHVLGRVSEYMPSDGRRTSPGMHVLKRARLRVGTSSGAHVLRRVSEHMPSDGRMSSPNAHARPQARPPSGAHVLSAHILGCGARARPQAARPQACTSPGVHVLGAHVLACTRPRVRTSSCAHFFSAHVLGRARPRLRTSSSVHVLGRARPQARTSSGVHILRLHVLSAHVLGCGARARPQAPRPQACTPSGAHILGCARPQRSRPQHARLRVRTSSARTSSGAHVLACARPQARTSSGAHILRLHVLRRARPQITIPQPTANARRANSVANGVANGAIGAISSSDPSTSRPPPPQPHAGPPAHVPAPGAAFAQQRTHLLIVPPPHPPP
ncbi:hypothetical protein K488DRAFT_86703 [Vararia minispora EC-137]|uniref:Uncharacterized protein n=1 Tax=Vararia minispora EC-137 TaxID=1314806 RepID=A0ACB8QIX8_9AGAM|nr:hypothetical protein K488DRAFT_86703 [Vararia minispora EC-137]